MNFEIKSTKTLLQELSQKPLELWQENYLSHYSTYWNAISTDPRLLLIPVDDHMVHRGDGIFEAFRSIENNFYLLSEHLLRLRTSAHKVSLSVPWTDEEIRTLVKHLAIAAKEPNLVFRLFVSRGAGSFSPNPYDCPKAHLTLIACRFKPYDQSKYSSGVTVGRSQILQKPEPFCTVKSCNYLSNVLMKKEAIDRKLDFVVAFNDQAFLTESATENIFLLTHNNELHHPRFQHILQGTTLKRCLELAHKKLNLTVKEVNITEKDLLESKEVFMIGTTLDILPVRQYEDKVFPHRDMASTLLRLLQEDQKSPK